MKISGQSPDGKTKVEFETALDDAFIERLAVFDLTEDDLRKKLNALAVSADVKSLLLSFASATFTIGRRVVKIGRKILDFAIRMLNEFPKLTFFAVLGAIAGLIVGSIPVMGAVLGPIVTPIAVAVGAAFGTYQDLQDHALGRKIAEFQSELAPLRAV